MHATNMCHPAVLRYCHLETEFRVKNKNLYRKICATYQLKGRRGVKDILHVMPFVGSREFTWNDCKQIFDCRELLEIDLDGWPLSNLYCSNGLSWYLRELMLANYAGYSIVHYGCLSTTMDFELPSRFSRAPVSVVMDLGWLDIFLKTRPTMLTKTEVDMLFKVFTRVWNILVSSDLVNHVQPKSPLGRILSDCYAVISEANKQKESETTT